MKVVHVPEGALTPAIVKEAIAALSRGEIVVHPTDTCYGLAVDITNPKALKRLYARKGMDLSKPVSILVPSLQNAQMYGVFPPLAIRLAKEFWPGPLTLVVSKTDAVPSCLNPGVDTIGIRVIKEPITNIILQAFGKPITTTSANLHGQPSPYTVEDISMEADLVLDAGELPPHEKPSTVIRVEGDQATTIRQGNLFLRV